MRMKYLLMCWVLIGTGEGSPGSSLLTEYEFDALRCDSIRTSASYSARKFCDPEAIEKEMGIQHQTEGGVYTVLQYSPTRKLSGIKCEKRMSSITAICGAFSHSKLITPPRRVKPGVGTPSQMPRVVTTSGSGNRRWPETQNRVRIYDIL